MGVQIASSRSISYTDSSTMHEMNNETIQEEEHCFTRKQGSREAKISHNPVRGR